jgi:DNA topoisomerase-1
VIVESPTKAKTLKRLLGKDFVVESSVGHVRDLPANAAEIPAKFKKEPWARLGIHIEERFKPLYVVSTDKKKRISELKKLAKEVDEILLATDEDREGEAISWHLIELLKPKVPVRRMVFHEITKSAILRSLDETRELDTDLVAAQEARRIIDRLYGYEVSPVLWRKIAPRLSAGRVQSVAIRMLVHRERERMRFVESRYWDLVARFVTAKQESFEARLVSFDEQRIAAGKDFDPDTGKLNRNNICLLDERDAAALREALEKSAFSVRSAEEKPFTRSPAPPFTTSSLQQEGNRKLRFDAKRTMRAAQRLYENGYITYMRTDSVVLSSDAIGMTRDAIASEYGREYLPDEPRRYKGKVKNAQEAHEAIRPAGQRIVPIDEMRKLMGGDEAKIYELIWKRTMACQMRNAQGRRMTLQIAGTADGKEAIFRATGNVIDFPGFLRAYVEGSDDPNARLADRETILPPLSEGDAVKADAVEAEEHATTPPARLTEATLVKALEESGIGRPSTYASILDTIERREYSFKKGTALVPTFTAFAVVNLMESNLAELVDTEFTARMEDRLDAISRGEERSLPYLEEFYHGNGTQGLRPLLDGKVSEVDPREICTIPLGEDSEGREIAARVGRYGPYLQRGESTAPIPPGTCPDELNVERAEQMLIEGERAEQPIGSHPETGEPVYVKSGRYGPYVQLGDPDPDDKKVKPKMVSLLRGMTPDTVDLDTALQLLALPRQLGEDENGVMVEAHNGRYGPYIKRDSDTRSLEPEDNLLTIDLARALALLSQEKRGRTRRTATPLKVLEGPDGEIKLLDGRYGPYVTDGTTNASLPKDFPDPAAITVEQAVELIEARRARGPAKKKRATKKKRVAKKKVAKKKKKTASKKKSSSRKKA